MLPRYHCEMNFIEYFWGAVKRYLRVHCDYAFDTLKENMPKAMASVPVALIRKWEHRMWQYVEAYDVGLDAKRAQEQVRELSSCKFAPHRQPLEHLGHLLDQLT